MITKTKYSTYSAGAITGIVVASGDVLVVVVGTHQGNISNVTYNGVALTKFAEANTAFNERTSLWYTNSPSTGTHDVAVSADGSHTGAVAYVLAGADNTIAPVKKVENGDSIRDTIFSDYDDCLFIDGIYSEATLSSPTQTSETIQNGASYESFGSSSYDDSSNDNGVALFGWTQASGQRASHLIVAFKALTSSLFPILLDNASNKTDQTAVSSVTLSHVTGTLVNGILVVKVGLRDATASDMTVTGVTYNGVALTKLRSDLWNSSTYAREEIWYLINPPAGTYNVVVSATGTCDFINVVAETWQGVDQTNPWNAQAGSGTLTTAGTSVTTNITPTINNNVILDNIWGKDDTISIGSGQAYPVTTLPEHAGTDYHACSFKRQKTAGATSMAWSWTNSEGYAHGIGVLAPASTVYVPRHPTANHSNPAFL